jgi:Dehydratase medium subunit
MTGTDERPAVLVYRHPDAPAPVLREICAGAEEEGVPTDVVELSDRQDSRDATALAHAAAQASRLDVGVGLDASGAAAVHHGKLPATVPATSTALGAGPPEWRRTGHIAARVVKGLPLG